MFNATAVPSEMTMTLPEALAAAGHAAPSADNSQPWRFYANSRSLIISYDRNRVQGTTFPAKAHATQLAIGGVIEHIAQAADALGISLDIEKFPRDCPFGDCYARIFWKKSSLLVPSPLKHPLQNRQTNRFAFSTTPIPKETLKTLGKLTINNAEIILFTHKKTIDLLAELVRSATEVRFQTREIHEWLSSSLRFSESEVSKYADGLDVRTLDLPPGGRQFLRIISDWKRIETLNKVGIYKLLAKIDAAPVRKAPAIVAIVGEATPTGALDAGRLLSRVWIRLNTSGIAVHPYFVVPDQIFRLGENAVPRHLRTQIQGVEQETRRILGLTRNQALYMLLRVGYPTRKAPRSHRLPMEKVFTDLTRNPLE